MSTRALFGSAYGDEVFGSIRSSPRWISRLLKRSLDEDFLPLAGLALAAILLVAGTYVAWRLSPKPGRRSRVDTIQPAGWRDTVSAASDLPCRREAATPRRPTAQAARAELRRIWRPRRAAVGESERAPGVAARRRIGCGLRPIAQRPRPRARSCRAPPLAEDCSETRQTTASNAGPRLGWSGLC